MKIHGFKSRNLLEELSYSLDLMENPYSFEDYCDACDNFQTEFCPFRDKVNIATKWKRIGCNNFWD